MSPSHANCPLWVEAAVIDLYLACKDMEPEGPCIHAQARCSILS